MKMRGHESFYLRRGWLQKGIKNIQKNDRIFNSKESNACDTLGIGANMVRSLKYWLIATGVAEEIYNDEGKKILVPSKIGKTIDKYDKFYEELGTNMLVHYKLVSNEEDATAWFWLFNEYEGNVIDKEIFERELKDYIKMKYGKEVLTGYDEEFNCIIKTYIQSEKDEDPEETKISPLSELGLLSITDSKKKEYRKNSLSVNDIHPLIAFAIICDMARNETELSVDDICNKKCGLGKTFNLTRTTVIGLLDILAKRGYVKLTRTAGLDVINILKSMSSIEAVTMYYKELNGER